MANVPTRRVASGWSTLLIAAAITTAFVVVYTAFADHGDDPGAFMWVLFVGPVVVLARQRVGLAHQLTIAAALNVGWVGVAYAFWDYRDRPWFEPERTDCDGPCYGWWSFENEFLTTGWLFGAAIGIVPALLVRAALVTRSSRGSRNR